MAQVEAKILEIELEGDHTDKGVLSVAAVCTRCRHRTESYGRSERSVKRCLVLLREECPMGETNFYVGDDGGLSDG